MNQVFSQQLKLDQPLATKFFQKSADTNKFAKAYLLVGHAKKDKWRLVFELTAYLNCEKIKTGEKESCLNKKAVFTKDKWCANCRWIEADQHPQALLKLVGNNKSGKIAVEDARAFSEEVSKTSPYFRVMVVEEASQEILHRPAANTLLKTIEEPRSQVLMVFFAQVTADVLPTITSRCQTITMSSKQYKDCWSLGFSSNFEESFLANQDKDQFQKITTSLEKFTSQESNFTDAINLVENIQYALKEGIDFEVTLDYIIARDLSRIESIFSPGRARYAKELFLIGQIAKEQSKHYVSEKALIETFIHAWHRLNKTGSNPLKIQSK